MNRRQLTTAVTVGAAVLASGYAALQARGTTANDTPSRVTKSAWTSQATVVDQLPDRPGYDRDCGKGRGCVFGPAWSDDTNAPSSRNGCDTRSDVLRTQLHHVQTKPGTHGCIVATGTLTEPYTGETIRYQRTRQPATVHVDHVIPLAWAWNAGAHAWNPDQRATFANDPRNLTASSASSNLSKSDQGPAQWAQQITDPGRRCTFLRKAKAVTTHYGLATTSADIDAFSRCGTTVSKP